MAKKKESETRRTPIVNRYEKWYDHPLIDPKNGILPDEPFACVRVGFYKPDRLLIIAPGADPWCVFRAKELKGSKYFYYHPDRTLEITEIIKVKEASQGNASDGKKTSKKDSKKKPKRMMFKAVFKEDPGLWFELKAPSDASLVAFIRNEAEEGRLDPKSFIADFEKLFSTITKHRNPGLSRKLLSKARELAANHPLITDNVELFDYLACTTFTDLKKHERSIRLLIVFLALEKSNEQGSSTWKYSEFEAAEPGRYILKEMPEIAKRYRTRFGGAKDLEPYMKVCEQVYGSN